jgi:capsid assembly protease
MNVLDILNSPWAIEPKMLNEMWAIYASHVNGEARDIKAIEAAIGKTFSNDPKPYTVQDGVATIPIEGVLAKRMGIFQQICGGQSYTSIQQDLATALADPDVASIILAIYSPGGAVDGCEACADAIFAARGQKPIVSYVDGKATSAAYWLGSAASQMYIGSSADQVGAIGVISQHVDTSNAEHQRGVKVTDLTAGRYKAVGSQHAPLSAQDRSTIQDHLDQLYGGFVDTVARNRGTDSETVLKNMADGRVFVGQKAIDAGLVDGKTTLPQLMQKMKSQQGGANSGAPNPKPMQKGKTSMSAENETTFTAAQLQAAKDEAHKAGLTAGLVQGRAEGATAERERIQAVEKVALPGHEKLIATLKFDGKTSGPEAAVQVLAAENTLRGDELAKLRAEAPKPVPASPGSAAADAEAANAKKEPTAIDAGAVAEQARTLVAKAKAEGKNLSFASAVAQLTAK